MSNRAKKAQEHVIEEKLEEMLEWYLLTAGKAPEQVAVDKKSYRGIVMRWFEPMLPNTENPVLVEEQLGDSWTLRLEPATGLKLIK